VRGIYQIGIFTELEHDAALALRSSTSEMLRNMGIEEDAYAFFDKSSAAAIDPKSPFVGVYVNLSQHEPALTIPETELIANGKLVIPVYPKGNFSAFAPRELADVNGMAVEPYLPDWSPVAALILESLDLLRKTRRVFISYKREETSAVAIQLYEQLDSSGFDVFLDTHSIRPGEVFQETLWHRMADSDVVLLLDSPDFLKSRWTRAELARANVTNIQIVQVLWPNQVQSADASLTHPINLKASDFCDPSVVSGSQSRIKDEALRSITSRVESVRARALGARYAHVVQEFHGAAKSQGLRPVVQRLRFITFESEGRKYAVVPTIGVPDSLRYQDAEALVETAGKHVKVALLYDERGVMKSWLQHLAWLDKHPAVVKSVQVPASLSWLKSL
jgi:hypothetical protein